LPFLAARATFLDACCPIGRSGISSTLSSFFSESRLDEMISFYVHSLGFNSMFSTLAHLDKFFKPSQA
jgi:hypothetical protein